MQKLIQAIGLKITKTGEKYKAWKDQFQITEEQEREKRGHRLTKEVGKIGGFSIPMHLIEYFEMHPEVAGEKEPWEKAIDFMQEKRNTCKHKDQA